MTDYTNDTAETLDFSEASPITFTKVSSEALDLNTFYPAQPTRYVGSDLGIYTGVLSADEVAMFMRSRSPIGFSPFKDFVAGEYKFQKGYVDFEFEPYDGADAQLVLIAAKVVADVPDKSETNSGTITSAESGLTVAFATAFAAAPKVVITPISSAAPLIPVLTAAPTTTGFTAKLFDLTGTAVTGSFIWTAIGY